MVLNCREISKWCFIKDFQFDVASGDIYRSAGKALALSDKALQVASKTYLGVFCDISK